MEDNMSRMEENEQELDRIIEEKLYVSKKNPLRDVTNLKGSEKPLLDVQRQPLLNVPLKSVRNTTQTESIGTHKESIDDVEMIPIAHQPIPKESTLIEIYEDCDLQDVFKTKELLSSNSQSPINDIQSKTFSINGKTITPENYKEKFQKLEKEFEILLQTHKETLQMKSKVYKFIYSEIFGMKKEYNGKIEELEKENERLKEEKEELMKKIEIFKGEFKKYNNAVREKAIEWKKRVEEQVLEYLKRR